MAKKHRSAVKQFIANLVLISFLLPLVIPASRVFAAERSNSQYYAARAAESKRQAVEKAREARQIEEQMRAIDGRINSLANSLNQTDRQIKDGEWQTVIISRKINDKEDELALTRIKLEKILASWYMAGEGELLYSIAKSENISQAVTEKQYYDSIRQQIADTTEHINQIKTDLQSQKSSLENNVLALKNLKDDQANQQRALEEERDRKYRLLSDTKNTLASLENEAREADRTRLATQQKITALTGTASWGRQIVSSEDSSWYYRQLDYPNVGLGNSGASIAFYGCLVSSIAMVATYYGHQVSPPMIAANDGIFSNGGSLMVTTPPGIGVTVIPSQPVDWSVINDELANNRPVIVSLYVPAVGALNGDGSSHFIVLRARQGDKYLMHDPLGANRGYELSQARSMKLVRAY